MNYITTISVLISVVCILLAAVITTAIFWLSKGSTQIHYPEVLLGLASSLAAAGIVSFLFLVVRSYEKREVETREKRVDDIHKALLAGRIYTDNPQLHCIFANHPTEGVADAINAAPLNETLEVDALGLNLGRFMEEQIQPELLRERVVNVRLVTHHPEADHLDELCQREGRNLLRIKELIIDTTARLDRIVADMEKPVEASDSVELHWSHDFSTITMVRINNRIFVRPRLLNEASFDVVYEVYDKGTNPKAFAIYMNYFIQTWNSSKKPNVRDYSKNDA